MLPRILLGTLLMAGCEPAPPPHVPEIDGGRTLDYVRTQLDFGPRVPGTEGHRRMPAWLDSLLRARADTVTVQAWDHTAVDGAVLPMRNLIARFNPGETDRHRQGERRLGRFEHGGDAEPPVVHGQGSVELDVSSARRRRARDDQLSVRVQIVRARRPS